MNVRKGHNSTPDGRVFWIKFFVDDYGIPCDESKAGGYNFIKINPDGKSMSSEHIIGRLDDPHRKKAAK